MSLLAVSGILLLAAGCNNTQQSSQQTPAAENQVMPQTQNSAQSTPPATDQSAGVASTTGQAMEQTFTVTGKNFSFSPSEIKVHKGDKVKIIFQNAEGFHNWILDDFSAKTKTIQAGQSDTIEFVADKTGTFEYYCGVMQHRQMGMKGNLIVQ